MSRKDNLIKSKSIYTIRSKHTSVPNGTIFENDHVTIISNDGIYNEDMALFSDSNFKFRIGGENKGKRRHSRGSFVNVGNNSTVWMLSNLPEIKKSTDAKIKLKPNYSSIKEFAYYGSAVELLKATVRDIIMRYPGGLYYYPENSAPSIKIGNETYYLVSNEFNIDFWSPIGCSTDEFDNPLRVLGANYMNYVDGSGNPIGLNVCINGYCPNSVIGYVSFSRQTEESVNFGNGLRGGLVDDANGNSRESVSREEYGMDIQKWNNLTVYCEYYTKGRFSAFPEGSKIEFYGYNGRYTFKKTALTNDGGYASVTLHDDDWVLISGGGEIDDNPTIQEIQTWKGLYDDGEYIGNTGIKRIDNGDFYGSILIIKDDINFPFIVYVNDCDNQEGIKDAEVDFQFKDENTDEWIDLNSKKTDSDGYAEFRKDEYFLAIQNIGNEVFPSSWRAVVYYNGVEKKSEELLVSSKESANVCFDNTVYNFNFAKIKVTGVIDNGSGTNGNIGPGYSLTVNFVGANNENVYITGETDLNGCYELTWNDFYAKYPNVFPASVSAIISYKNHTGITNTIRLPQNGSEPRSYDLTATFEGDNSIVYYSLSCQVKKENGAPVKEEEVAFNVELKNGESLGLSGITLMVDGASIATVTFSNEKGDIDRWWAYCNYEKTIYNSRTFSIKKGERNALITVSDSLKWTSITVNCTDTNENNLQNAYCVVCAKTETDKKWTYYASNVTDENGNAVFTTETKWMPLPGVQALNTSPNYFTTCIAYATYQGRTPNSTTESKNLIGEVLFSMSFVVETPLTPPKTIGCDKIDPAESSTFLIYMDGDGNKKLLTKHVPSSNASPNDLVIIEPKKKFFDEFWETLDDFEGVLLNRNSRPMYKAVLETPYVDKEKHYYDYRPYIWPTVNGYAPDTTSGVFNGYLNSLMKIAEYYDEYESDNLWRMLTHESIKNLDRSGIIYEDADYFDATRMEAMIRIHGRVYDDIIRYANGIKYVNSITYDEKNNIPDYFLSDKIELYGFDSKSINEFQKYETIESRTSVELTSDNVFSATMLSGITTFEVNGEFMKRFALSEKYILSEKGTRRGIESLLGMFGYRCISDSHKGEECKIGDYEITEYIRIANNFPNYNEISSLRLAGDYTHDDTPNENLMEGYPVAVVSPANSNGDFDYYIIPWYDITKDYVNGIYFQEKGGWGKIGKKNINLDITSVSEISEDYGVSLYNETLPYMRYVNNLDELISLSNNIVYNGLICYVTDIGDIYSRYVTQGDVGGIHENARGSVGQTNGDGTTTTIQPEIHRDYSHYFVLVNEALSTHIGYVQNDYYSCYGWRNILLSEFNDGAESADGLKVLYLESLSSNMKGNNPHCGYGNYDDGDRYIEKFNRLFGTAIDNGEFEHIKWDNNSSNNKGSQGQYGDGNEQTNNGFSKEYNAILISGFSIGDLIEDNDKCYYFSQGDTEIVYNRDGGYDVHTTSQNIDILNGSSTLIPILDENQSADTIDSGKYEIFVNPESGNSFDECAAFSVVNVKNFKITFYTNGNEYFEKYLNDVVFKYLIEMIPSTAIFEFEFKNCDYNVHNITEGDYYHEDSSVLGGVVGDGVTISNDDDEIYLIENNDGIVI